MCGIIGVVDVPSAARLSYLGLYALQHRGQEAAGIVGNTLESPDEHLLFKGQGLASEVLREEVLTSLSGDLALGHLRYSTAGGPGIRNAQPLNVTFGGGELALVHNGQLTNANSLRLFLAQEGATFQGSIDSEVILHLIARSRAPTTDEKIIEALSACEGAFSVLIAINDALYIARDRYGFRPLVMGRKESGFVFASESCALDIMGAEIWRDLEPGEILKVVGGEISSLPSLPVRGDSIPCIFELVYFARPDSRLWGVSVDRARRALGRALAIEAPADADCVIGIPDSANSAALGYSEISGIPPELGLIRNHYVGRTFIEPTQVERDLKVRLKYSAVREIIANKRIVLIDDSLVRGTTAQGLVRLLRDAGAREIHLRIASPPIRHPCYYGIDIPSREELVAAERGEEEIATLLGLDSLGYLSLEGMRGAIQDLGEQQSFCDACFSGKYQAPLVDAERGLPMQAGCAC